MGRSTPTPVAAATIWRNDIVREHDALAVFVNYKLQELQLGSPGGSPMRPGTAATGLSSSPSMLSRYGMLTSASAISLRRGNSRSDLPLNLTKDAAQTASHGMITEHQTWQQVKSRTKPSSLPPVLWSEARWPSIRHDALSALPLRPELRRAATAQMSDEMQWMGGVWRPRKAFTSPRPSII